jgi:hypothetical protein
MEPEPPSRAWTPIVDAGSHEPRLLDRVRLAVRSRHYSLRTEEAYVAWVRRFVLFHAIPVRKSSAVTTCTKPWCSEP